LLLVQQRFVGDEIVHPIVCKRDQVLVESGAHKDKTCQRENLHAPASHE